MGKERFKVAYGKEVIEGCYECETYEEAEELVEEIIKAWWPDHPTRREEFDIIEL